MDKVTDNFIAIVGMSCRFAGSADLNGFWRTVLEARPSFSDCPAASADRFLREPPGSLRHLPTLRAARLGDLWQTSEQSGPIPPGVNPAFILAADLATAAIKDATSPQPQGAVRQHDRLGAFIGHSPAIDSSLVAWFQHGFAIDQTLEIVRRCFPHGSPDDFETLKSSLLAALPQYDARGARNLIPHALASFVADSCNVAGPAVCIDGGDISATLAIEAACAALREGRVDAALAGAVQGPVSPQLMMPFARIGFLSKSGNVRPFSRDADGTLLGEGGGFLLLKRHADAVRDGNRIYAVVRAAASAAPGNSRRIEGGLAGAIRAVWPPDTPDIGTIDFLEANGAGIPNLDKAETKTFSSILGEERAMRDSIALGAVKALVGDCLAAAGVAGAVKAALALYNRVIPPALPPDILRTATDFSDTPFYLPPRARPWVHNDAGTPRRAGIASVGLGGIASLLVLEQTSR